MLALVALLALLMSSPVTAQSEPRIAFVVGNGAYAKGPLPNSLNDAGLVAEALRSVGFDIVEGADLSHADFIRSFRDFLARLDAAGPSATAFVYFSGYAFAFDGDNFLVAADARLDGDNDIPLDTMRLSDLLRALAGSPARAKVVAVDGARRLPFAIAGLGLPSGLSAIEPPRGMLIAYSAEPGTLIEDGAGAYGRYATAIAEMIRSPGLNVVDAFPRIRLRTHQLTEGRQVPWNASALGSPLVLVPPDPVPAAANEPPPVQPRRPRPMVELGPDEGYGLAIEVDDLSSYVEYLQAYPTSPYGRRIWAIVRARREALTWMRALEINAPDAYWTYRRRYPDGIYAADAERRLRRLSAPVAPPPGFAPVELAGVPPSLAQEPPIIIPYFRSPPRPPPQLIAPPPALFANLPPPRRAGARGLLPLPPPLPALPRVTPGNRMTVAPARLPGPVVRPPPVIAPPSTAIVRRPPARPPAGALALPTPRTFQPSPRHSQAAPGTAGIPLTLTPTVLQPSRRRGQPAAAPGLAGGQPQVFTPSRRQGGMPPGAAPPSGAVAPTPGAVTPPPAAALQQLPPPLVARPALPQAVRAPTPPKPPTVNVPPPIARAAPRQAAPARTCVVENGNQVCR
jgi:hypothetical protein